MLFRLFNYQAMMVLAFPLVVACVVSRASQDNAVVSGVPLYWPKFDGDRLVQMLDGIWNTSRIGSIDHPPPRTFDSMSKDFDPTPIDTEEQVPIPSTLDATPIGHPGYRGVSFFRRVFEFDLSNGARIQFQSCSFYCRIWINGVELGEHRTGYNAFWLDVPPIDSEEEMHSHHHEIFVLVDNRFNRTTAPLHTGGDFYEYSGIMRSVEVHSIPPKVTSAVLVCCFCLSFVEAHCLFLKFLPFLHLNSSFLQSYQDWPWRLYAFPKTLTSVQLELHLFHSDIPAKLVENILVGFDDGPRQSMSGIAKSGIVDLGIHEVPNPKTWGTTDPHLHTVQVEMNGAIVSERFGLRLWRIENARILLNGETLMLHGWNHHTQWPDTGASPTDQQLDDDIKLLKEGGANFVRGAHYPQDPRWLDRLDENGFVMWCETGFPGMSVKDLNDPYWRYYQAQQMNEMLDNAMNHASIALWAFFNEGPSNSVDSCDAYQENSDIIHTRDPTRFVTYASNHDGNDKCFAVVDVVSHNGYPGWYVFNAHPTDYWGRIANKLQDGSNPDTKGKPFIISETGASGIYEWDNNETAVPWTLKYQTQVIAEDVDVALANTNISGISLWHFFDFKVDDKWENNTYCDYLPNVDPPTCGYIYANVSQRGGRPGGANHKGSLDFWRRKKPIFDIVSAKYNATKQTSAMIYSDAR